MLYLSKANTGGNIVYLFKIYFSSVYEINIKQFTHI